MDPITIDGLEEDDFRCSIEALLREGEADAAAAKLRALIEPYAGEGRSLPARFLTVSHADFGLAGWHELSNRLGKYDRPGHWVSAVGISIVDPREAEALLGAPSRHVPCIETSFYSDDAYPFSRSDRSDLLEGYTRQGAEWQGNFEQADMTLSVTGVEDLFGAVAELEARLLASEVPDGEEIRAGSLAACYLSVLLHQAVREKIRSDGLPRPLCVMTGCVGVYPFFDAPAMSSIECLDGGFLGMEELAPSRQVAAQDKDEAVADADDSFGSLLSLTGRIAKKKMVMEIDAEESAAASRQFELATAHQLAEAGEAPPRGGRTDFSAYAFDDAAGPPVRDDDDWADIPDSPLFPQSRFNHEMDDWFGHSAEDRAAEVGDEDIAFPACDVAGWNPEDPAPGRYEFTPEPLTEDPPSRFTAEAGDECFAIEETPHPDAANYIPPPAPVGHGLRARLAMSAEPEPARREGPLAAIRRIFAWLNSRFL